MHLRQVASRWSRRQFFGMVGAGLLGASSARSPGAAGEPVVPRFLKQWGHRGQEPGEFNAGVGIAFGGQGEIYTCEFRNQRVQRFTTEGEFLGLIPVQPHAGGLAVDSHGTIYVAHWNSNKIAVYSSGGELVREWGAKGTGDGEFQLPGSIALGPDGLLYVPDQGNSRVQRFTVEGRFVGKWGTHGSEPGQFGGGQPVGGRFAGPQFVAFDRQGQVYTTDAALDRVSKFTAEGTLLGFWGSESSDPGGFGPPPTNRDGSPGVGGPIGICVDRHDRVWVSGTNSRVQLFANDGEFLCGLGMEGEGTDPGEFHVPHGLVLDAEGCLYVADTMNWRVQKFAMG